MRLQYSVSDWYIYPWILKQQFQKLTEKNTKSSNLAKSMSLPQGQILQKKVAFVFRFPSTEWKGNSNFYFSFSFSLKSGQQNPNRAFSHNVTNLAGNLSRHVGVPYFLRWRQIPSAIMRTTLIPTWRNTQVNCNWLMPTAVKEVPYAPVSDINFRSAKKLK